MAGNGQGGATDNPRLAALRAKLHQVQVEHDVGKDAFSEADREEIEIRKQIAATEDAVHDQARARRKLDLDRRLEAVQETFPKAKLAPVMIKGFEDTFIVKHDGKAYARFQQEAVTRNSSGGKKGPTFEESKLEYAMAVIVDWNGTTDWSAATQNGHNLRAFLKVHTGVCGPVTDAAWELAGCAADDSKS
jgi:hypothetical protein